MDGHVDLSEIAYASIMTILSALTAGVVISIAAILYTNAGVRRPTDYWS